MTCLAVISYPVRDKLSAFVSLTRINRPIGIYLLMWPMLWALWFAAKGVPDVKVLVIFILGTVLTRSAGCAINDYADRHIDAHVERTAGRPLATGALSSIEALLLAAVLMMLAFLLVLFTNKLTILMSFVALALATVYPFTKRITHWPQAFLGAAFACAVPMAFAAQINNVPSTAWVIFAAAVIWAMAYDTLYAMTDRAFDLKIGVMSTAILFAKYDLLAVAVLQITMLALMLGVGLNQGRQWIYLSGFIVAAALIIRQLYRCKTRDPQRCFEAFLNNNYVGMSLFIALALDFAVFPA